MYSRYRTPLASRFLQVLQQCLLLLVTAALLWLFHLYARVLGDVALLSCYLLLTLLITVALGWRAQRRRAVFLHAYIAGESRLQDLLRGRLLLYLRQLPLALILALVLAVTLTRMDDERLWLVLLAAAPLLALLCFALQYGLRRQASPQFLDLLVWRLASLLLFLALLVAVIWLSLAQPWPDFRGIALDRAIWHMAEREQARNVLFQELLQLSAALDGLRLWLAQQVLPTLTLDRLLLLAGWSLVFAKKALFVWSYLLILSAVLVLTAKRGR